MTWHEVVLVGIVLIRGTVLICAVPDATLGIVILGALLLGAL